MARLVLTSAADNVVLWDQEYNRLQSWVPPGGCSSLSISAKNTSTLTCSFKNKVTIRSLKAATPLVVLADDAEPTCATFFNDSESYLSVGTSSGQVRTYKVSQEEDTHTLSVNLRRRLQAHKVPIECVALSRRDTHIASGSANGICVCNLLNYTPGQLKTDGTVKLLTYNRYQRSLLAAAHSNMTVALYDTQQMKRQSIFKESHLAPVTGIAFSPVNDKLLLSAGLDKQIIMHDVASGSKINTMTFERPLTSLAFGGNGVTVATGTSTGEIIICDLRLMNKETYVERRLAAHTTAVTCLEFCRGSGTSGESLHETDVSLYDLSQEDHLATPAHSSQALSNLAISPLSTSQMMTEINPLSASQLMTEGVPLQQVITDLNLSSINQDSRGRGGSLFSALSPVSSGSALGGGDNSHPPLKQPLQELSNVLSAESSMASQLNKARHGSPTKALTSTPNTPVLERPKNEGVNYSYTNVSPAPAKESPLRPRSESVAEASRGAAARAATTAPRIASPLTGGARGKPRTNPATLEETSPAEEAAPAQAGCQAISVTVSSVEAALADSYTLSLLEERLSVQMTRMKLSFEQRMYEMEEKQQQQLVEVIRGENRLLEETLEQLESTQRENRELRDLVLAFKQTKL